MGETDPRGEMREGGVPRPLTNPGRLPCSPLKPGVSVDLGMKVRCPPSTGAWCCG